jgi:ERCC4-type nuclease
MIIKIDVREQELLSNINKLVLFTPIFKQLKVSSENLPLGDIIIEDEKEEKIIIERKTINDLLASIKDGRYDEQSYRLNGLSHHNHNIIYLIEGDVNKMNRFKETSQDKLTSYSAMFSLNYYKGFSVFRSFNLDETAMIICNMAYKLDKNSKNGFYSNISTTILSENLDKNIENIEKIENIPNLQSNENSNKNYVSVIKKVKKDNITIENIDEIMLCQIPGISSVTAIAIIKKFKTLSNLLKELELNSDCLKDTNYTTEGGQLRKINRTCIENIVKFLLKK